MFKINTTSLNEDGQTLLVDATFTLADGTETELLVPIFRPQTTDDVMLGLSNREQSEQAAYDAQIVAKDVKSQLDSTSLDVSFSTDKLGKVIKADSVII